MYFIKTKDKLALGNRRLSSKIRRVAGILTLAGLLLALVAPALRAAELTPEIRASIYDRTTNQFARADYFKPIEAKTNGLAELLAPLIMLQTEAGDGRGKESVRPTLFWDSDTITVHGRPHARFSYVWFYAGTRNTPRAFAMSPIPQYGGDGREPQGVRITLNSAGLPVIWEILADPSGAQLIFVARSVETAAAAEFGAPLASRRYSVEAGLTNAPDVIVPRLIEDSAAALGPILYLAAPDHNVSTLLCRCMPAQAKQLGTTTVYSLAPLAQISSRIERMQDKLPEWSRARFPARETVEKLLRLPTTF